jgi:hypothetical protein
VLRRRAGTPCRLIAETLLARRLLQVELDAAGGPLALAPADPRDRSACRGRVMGTSRRRLGARALVLLVDGRVLVVDPATARIEPGRNLAGEPREIVTVDGPALAEALSPIDVAGLRLDGAWTRSLLMLGAMETALEVAATYANDRVQFGRPIGKQQSIQHQLALMAEEASAVAARLATERLDGDQAFLAVAPPRSRCGEAAGKAAEYAHQVMGAIGFTTSTRCTT